MCVCVCVWVCMSAHIGVIEEHRLKVFNSAEASRRVVRQTSRLGTSHSMMTRLFGISPTVAQKGIPQFHESIYTMPVEVLWLLVKSWCDCLLHICVSSKALTFVCLFCWPEHMTITGKRISTVGGMWKNFPPILLQLLMMVLAECGLALSWRRMITHNDVPSLLAFTALLKRSRNSPYQLALTMMPLGNQSISRGPQQLKTNVVSITLPALGMAWLFFNWRDDECFHYWLTCWVFRWYCKHYDSYPLSIPYKNLSPSLSYRSTCSKKMPM